jgi:tRNA A37 threonylcarbamoyladenosine synthetase subunit TsaC/SUA5/YrdC
MELFDYRADAARVMDALLGGGIAVVPTTVGYVILGCTTPAINRIVAAKRRGASKLNAMVGCTELHAALHVLPARSRAAVRTVTERYDLPLGAVAPARLDHPMLGGLDAAVLSRTTLDGTIAMLMNAGPLLNELGRLSFEAGRPVIGSSANMSLKGTKFRVEHIEKEVLDIAELVIDYGLMRWAAYRRSSTMINVHDFTVVRHGSCFDLIADVLRRHFDILLAPPRD